MDLDEFKEEVKNVPDGEFVEMDRLCFEWLEDLAEESGDDVAARLLGIVKELIG